MSRWLSPYERRMLWRRRRRVTLGVLVATLVVLNLDRPLYLMLDVGPQWRTWLVESDSYQMFRAAGFLPTWILIGTAMLLHTLGHWLPWLVQAGARKARRRPLPPLTGRDLNELRETRIWGGALVILAASLSGLAAEVIKPIAGRLRPMQTDGHHRFHGLPDDLMQSPSHGFPSSHAAVAFAAAVVLLHLYPRAGMVALAAAAGCGVARMLVGAHFASDIIAAAILGYAVARLVVSRFADWVGGAHGVSKCAGLPGVRGMMMVNT